MSTPWLTAWLRRPATPAREKRPRRVVLRLEATEDRTTPSVSVNLAVPASSAFGVTNSLTVQYRNTGASAVPAPVLIVTAPNANLWLPTNPSVVGHGLQILAASTYGPAGTLAPGASGSVVVDFTATSGASGPISFSVGQMTAGQSIDWSTVKSQLQPSYMSAAGWNAAFNNFVADVGGTTDALQAALDADATYLGPLGGPTVDVAALVAFEIDKADGDFGSAAAGWPRGRRGADARAGPELLAGVPADRLGPQPAGPRRPRLGQQLGLPSKRRRLGQRHSRRGRHPPLLRQAGRRQFPPDVGRRRHAGGGGRRLPAHRAGRQRHSFQGERRGRLPPGRRRQPRHRGVQRQRPVDEADLVRRRRPHARVQRPGLRQPGDRPVRRGRPLRLRRRRPAADRRRARGDHHLRLRDRHRHVRGQRLEDHPEP